MQVEVQKKEFSIEGKLRAGVISDSQLSPFANGKVNTYQRNLIQSLKTLKKLQCNLIMFAGDICNVASKYAYRRYKDAFRLVFGEDMPLVISVMGNHDYYGAFFARKLFEKELGQKPYTHYVINGFHFIGVSPDCCSLYRAYSKVTDWLDKELAEAVADAPEKPVFVITHHPPKDTVYGSDDWGDETLGAVFSKYKNVVDFAGHSHYSLMDERSYYNGAYRVFNTQSVSYIELERGKINGSVPPLAHVAPMGLILDFGEDNIDVLRINLLDGKEQKADMRISIPCDLGKDKTKNYIYNPDFPCEPVMPKEYGSWYREDNATYIEFTEGADEDFVHSYLLEFSDGTIQTYFSDFYKGEEFLPRYGDRKVSLRLYGKKRGTYDIKVYALDSQNNKSKSFTQIEDVEVCRKDVYKRKLAPDICY